MEERIDVRGKEATCSSIVAPAATTSLTKEFIDSVSRHHSGDRGHRSWAKQILYPQHHNRHDGTVIWVCPNVQNGTMIIAPCT